MNRTQYLNNFRIFLSQYLKTSVRIRTISYPYNEGCVIVITLGYDIQTRDETTNANSLHEALQKTTLFENIPDSFDIHGTSISLTANKIVIIKNNTENLWTEDAANEDVQRIIREIRSNS